MRCAAAPLTVILLVVGACSHGPQVLGRAPESGTVRARLVAGDEVLPSASILATRSPGVAFEEEVRAATADSEGTALLELPAGAWYLTGRSADGSLFGYYGPNPVQVAAGREITAAIRGSAGHVAPQVRPAAGGMTGIEGAVTGEKGPLREAAVAFYLDASSQFRGPAYSEVNTDDAGRFEAFLSPGRYFIVVRKRSAGAGRFGPLVTGDHFGYYAANPVMVGEGQRLAVAVGAVEVQRRSGWTGASPSRLRLSGVVRDVGGRPLEGYRAFLHADPAMLGKPDFVSETSGSDGRYEIWVEREGVFFLGARRELGRARELGEALGRYEGSGDSSVRITLPGREMRGYDIVVGGAGAP